MYSVVLALSFAGAADMPAGIFFNRHAAGASCAGATAGFGCNGSAVEVRLMHVQAGSCGGGFASGGPFRNAWANHHAKAAERHAAKAAAFAPKTRAIVVTSPQQTFAVAPPVQAQPIVIQAPPVVVQAAPVQAAVVVKPVKVKPARYITVCEGGVCRRVRVQ